MAATYEPIATTTVSSAVSNVTFTSVPQTYTDLIVIATVKGTTGGDLALQFNNDNGNNYSVTYLYGTGSSAGSFRLSNRPNMPLDYYAGVNSSEFNNEIIQIQNYSNTTTNKSVLVRANNTGGLDATVGLWRNTSAITTIDFFTVTASGNFAVGCTFTLYGIKAA